VETSPIEHIAALIDPAKLATLAPRGANPRVQKSVAQSAVARVGMQGEAEQLTVEAMRRNLTIAQRLGCLGPEGLAETQILATLEQEEQHDLLLPWRGSSKNGWIQ